MSQALRLICPGCKEEIPSGHASLVFARTGQAFHFGCEKRKTTFYKVIHNGCDSCTWQTREEAESDVEQNAESYFEETAENWRIEEVLMTYEEFAALDEHQGW